MEMKNYKCGFCDLVVSEIPKFKKNECVEIQHDFNKIFELELTDEERDILFCLVENEIKSNEDYINNVEENEKEYWSNHTQKLKKIKEGLNGIRRT